MKVTKYLARAKQAISDFRGLKISSDRILFLNQQWPYHASRSGYHLVSEGLGPNLPRDARLLPGKFVLLLSKLRGKSRLVDRITIKLGLWSTRARALVICDGEFDLPVISEFCRIRGVKVIVVFHQPLDKLAPLLKSVPPGKIDAVICVSRYQIPTVKEALDTSQVWFIPHGVDVEFFIPADVAIDPDLVLTVGRHRRDADTLLAVAREVKKNRPQTRFLWVGPAGIQDQISSDSGTLVEVETGISDAALLNRYQSACVHLAPLTAATANNSLLEAMATGTPSVITDIGGVRDYTVDNTSLLSPPGDVQAMSQQVLQLLEDRRLRSRLAKASRKRAEELAWPNVQRELVHKIRELE